KHRQIHRMIEALGYFVDKLQRVAFGNLTFHHLRVGDARELTQQELNELRDLVELDHSAVARGKWRANREATDIPRRARAKAIAEAEPGRDDREDTWEWSDSDRSSRATQTRGREGGSPRPSSADKPRGQGRSFGKRAPQRSAVSGGSQRGQASSTACARRGWLRPSKNGCERFGGIGRIANRSRWRS